MLRRTTSSAAARHSPFFDSEQKSKQPQSYLLPTLTPQFQRARPVRAVLLSFIVFALFTRLYRISAANAVVWDEAHFGKFAGFYNSRKWFTDLHPPLGKSMLGLFSYLGGFDGSWPFESGHIYPPNVPYVFMRRCCAVLAAMCVPLAYLTGLEIGLKQDGAIFLGLLAGTDIAMLTLSRFILLDPLLLFFTSLSIFSVCRFRNFQKNEPFSRRWVIWLGMTGFSLGCCVSVKWVGLFVIAVVGLHTVNDLISLFFDKNVKTADYVKHWVYRILLLIILPVSIYLIAFKIHFAVLNHSGSGDSKMGSLFQYHLVGSTVSTGPVHVVDGSEVLIRYHGAGGGFIHSHPYAIEGENSSKEQQATLYVFREDGNNRLVIRAEKAGTGVYSGDIVRLEHKSTQKFLRSQNYAAPVSKRYREVSFGGNKDVVDPVELWRVIVIDDVKWGFSSPLRTLTTRFRLQHVQSGCYLRADFLVHLPKWGFEQNELACTLDRISIFNSRNSLWNIDEHWNDKLPPGQRSDYPRSFYTFFMEDNSDKLLGNSMLVRDPNQAKSSIESDAWEWPTLHAKLEIGGGSEMYAVLGMPIIWGGVTVSLLVYVMFATGYLSNWIRTGSRGLKTQIWQDFWFVGKLGFFGWLVNFIPYVVMPRVTYIHHYLPALQFGMVLYAFTLNHLLHWIFPKNHGTRTFIMCAFSIVDILSFIYYRRCSFGHSHGTSKTGWF